MTTTRKLLKGSLRLINVIGANEEPTADDADITLRSLNGLVDSLGTDLLNIHTFTPYRFALTPGQQTYTLGPALAADGTELNPDWVVTRPNRIEQAKLLLYPTITPAAPPPIIEADFTTLPNGSLLNVPALRYDPAYGSGVFGVWPPGANTSQYDGETFPQYWNGFTSAEGTATWYIQNGALYFDGDQPTFDELFLPIFLPLSVLEGGVRFTVRFKATGVVDSVPAPQIAMYSPRSTASNPQVAHSYLQFLDNVYLIDASPFDWPGGSSDSDYPVPDINGPEHELVWELNLNGRIRFTYDGVQKGPLDAPWFSGYAPAGEAYLNLSSSYTYGYNSAPYFGYTYLKVEKMTPGA